MRVKEHNKTILKVITCVCVMLLCKWVLPLHKNCILVLYQQGCILHRHIKILLISVSKLQKVCRNYELCWKIVWMSRISFVCKLVLSISANIADKWTNNVPTPRFLGSKITIKLFHKRLVTWVCGMLVCKLRDANIA